MEAPTQGTPLGTYMKLVTKKRIIFKITLLNYCVYKGGCVCVTGHHTHVEVRGTIHESQFSPLTLQILGNELGSSGLGGEYLYH